jgi:ABC-type Na+ transport system ATPase subunit NatA
MDHVIWAEGMVRRFGETTALDGVDLGVRTGTVLGLLGPNGAGKTTVLSTLLEPDAGRAKVGGFDVVDEAHQVRQPIGLTGQYAAVGDAQPRQRRRHIGGLADGLAADVLPTGGPRSRPEEASTAAPG